MLPGLAYGESSGFHLLLGPGMPEALAGDLHDPGLDAATLKRGLPAAIATPLHCGMLLHGVHLFRGRGLLSTAHDERDVAQTLEAFEATLRRMQREGVLP